MSFKPTFDRVVIERDAPESVSPGGIVIPGKAQEKATKGYVRAVGEGRWGPDAKRIPVGVAEGDYVMFEPYNGTEFKTDEPKPRTMIVVSETAILGVIS